ncbi:hypothetical protein [Rhodococcus koreensis]|uniref:hypothetical protein n=1 Tax=Rhodococcus koreensis TaxID=99653 RepID=UPI00366F6556
MASIPLAQWADVDHLQSGHGETVRYVEGSNPPDRLPVNHPNGTTGSERNTTTSSSSKFTKAMASACAGLLEADAHDIEIVPVSDLASECQRTVAACEDDATGRTGHIAR